MKRRLIFLLILSIDLSFCLSLNLIQAEEIEAPVKALFSPQDNCAREIISYIDGAKKSIYAAIYCFTSRPIAQALVRAEARGVDVKVCTDNSRDMKYSKFSYLKKKGIKIRQFSQKGLMHHKFCVIDGETVLSGSYNWTRSADLRNDENLLIINSKELAKLYENEFNNIWNGTKIDEFYYKDEIKLEKIPTG